MSEKQKIPAKASPGIDSAGIPLFSRDHLLERLSASRGLTGDFGKHLHWFDSTDSTNDEAARLAAGGAPEGSTVVAFEQRRGRGRQGRGWTSEPGQNITASIVLRPPVKPEILGIVSLCVAAAVAESVSALAAKPARCKWPNDVLIGDRKVAGILCESSIAGGSVRWVVAGIGVNVNQDRFPDEFAGRTTSLLLETGRLGDPALVLCSLLASLRAAWRPGDPSWPAAVAAAWSDRSAVLGSRVTGTGPGGRFSGIARAVTGTGTLLVDTLDPPGRTIEIAAGDVHMLPRTE